MFSWAQAGHLESGAGCVVEALEQRQFMSATTVLASLRPLASWPAHVVGARHANIHEMGPKLLVGSRLTTKFQANIPDMVGTWSGTFTDNSTRTETSGGISFNVRKKLPTQSIFTGTFNVSAVAGSNVLASVTIPSNRRFLAVLRLPGKQQMSMAGNVTSDGMSIIGRYSVEGRRPKWATGVFTLRREVPDATT